MPSLQRVTLYDAIIFFCWCNPVKPTFFISYSKSRQHKQNILWPGKIFSLTWCQAGSLCCIPLNIGIEILHNRFFKNIPHGISVSLEKGSQSLIQFSTQRGKDDTKSSSEWRNNEANMPWWNSVSGLSPPAWLPHKGHQSSAETAQSRGLSVSVWVDECVHKKGWVEKREEDLPT